MWPDKVFDRIKFETAKRFWIDKLSFFTSKTRSSIEKENKTKVKRFRKAAGAEYELKEYYNSLMREGEY